MAGEIYLCHTNEAEAREQGALLGIEFPVDGTIPTGNTKYSLVAPIQAPYAVEPVYSEDGEVVTPGVLEEGYWSMLWLNPEWDGYVETLEAIEKSGIRRHPEKPTIVFA